MRLIFFKPTSFKQTNNLAHMKKILFTGIALLTIVYGYAQTSASIVKTPVFPSAMQQVLHDFPANFHHISGELVLKQAEIENYESLVRLPGSEACIVTRYHSVEDTTASWQAKMFRSEDFNTAALKYKTLYQQLKGCYLQLVDGSIIYLTSEYENPVEEKPFAVSTLRLKTGDDRYREMKIDLEMIYQFPEWVININVVSKKKDTLEGYANADGSDK